jgi:hypothetical protein
MQRAYVKISAGTHRTEDAGASIKRRRAKSELTICRLEKDEPDEYIEIT